VTLGAASLVGTNRQSFLLSPFEFQLNGSEPYTIEVLLRQGETISGNVNATGQGTLSFVLGGSVLQAQPLRADDHYKFTAPSSATYQLVFESRGSALVWFDIRT